MKILRYLGVVFLFNCACSPEVQKKENKNTDLIQEPGNVSGSESYIHSLINNAVTKGDTNDYFDARTYYWRNENTQAFLYTSLIMANKYHFVEAYYDLYATLAYPNTGETIETLDQNTRCMALYYLLKVYEKGDSQAKDAVEIMFKNKKIPSSSFYLIELSKSK